MYCQANQGPHRTTNMRIHHLNCGTLRPVGRRLLTGEGGWRESSRLVSHCLLLEGRQGLALIGSGLGTRDVSHPDSLSPMFHGTFRPRLLMMETALHQVRELGFDPHDIKHIVLTHLDQDQAGGLADFPHAQVHVHAHELEAALRPRTLHDKVRYLAAQWAHQPHWISHQGGEGSWFGLKGATALPDFDHQVLLIPLPGHTAGHMGVAIQTSTGWLLHAGDAYFYRGEMDVTPSCPVGLKWLQWMMAHDHSQRIETLRRLRRLAHRFPDDIQITSSHDPVEFNLLSSQKRHRSTPLAVQESHQDAA